MALDLDLDIAVLTPRPEMGMGLGEVDSAADTRIVLDPTAESYPWLLSVASSCPGIRS